MSDPVEKEVATIMACMETLEKYKDAKHSCKQFACPLCLLNRVCGDLRAFALVIAQ